MTDCDRCNYDPADHTAAGCPSPDDPHVMNRKELEAEVGRLRKENAVLTLKARVADRLPFCPDHRDKVAGKDCRECEIERLKEAERTQRESYNREIGITINQRGRIDELKEQIVAQDARLATAEREVKAVREGQRESVRAFRDQLKIAEKERDERREQVEELLQRQDEIIVALGGFGIMPNEIEDKVVGLIAERDALAERVRVLEDLVRRGLESNEPIDKWEREARAALTPEETEEETR